MKTRRWLGMLLSLALVPVVALGTAPPAAAAVCATAGHTYAIYNGSFYSSGFEGNHQNGIQYIVLPAGTPFQVGGNGIKPGIFLQIDIYKTDMVPPGWENLAQQSAFRQKAGGNCVANQKWAFPNTNPTTGIFQLRARYTAGNSNANVEETIVFLIFI